jgi:hypothetical protein
LQNDVLFVLREEDGQQLKQIFNDFYAFQVRVLLYVNSHVLNPHLGLLAHFDLLEHQILAVEKVASHILPDLVCSGLQSKYLFFQHAYALLHYLSYL